jgi:hypothetical protein
MTWETLSASPGALDAAAIHAVSLEDSRMSAQAPSHRSDRLVNEGPLTLQIHTVVRSFLGSEARTVLEGVCQGMIGVAYESVSSDNLGSLIYWLRIFVQKRKLLDEQQLHRLVHDLEGLRGARCKPTVRQR